MRGAIAIADWRSAIGDWRFQIGLPGRLPLLTSAALRLSRVDTEKGSGAYYMPADTLSATFASPSSKKCSLYHPIIRFQWSWKSSTVLERPAPWPAFM